MTCLLRDEHKVRNRIRLLDSHTINQIAAGEVVERPASVVKELVENALDAGATKISVELQDAGKRLIRVHDNGCGMSLEEAKLCLERHATSKISSLADLERVTSFGFRGEAIPSISSVSRMSLSTSMEDGLRHILHVEGGRLEKVEKTSGPQGTEIRVEDLFFNTPARLKFLKSDSTELSACIEYVAKYVLAHPEVAFRLTHGTKTLIQSSGSGDLLTAISEAWGRELAMGLAEIECAVGDIGVKGFISPPHLTRPTRSHQWIYVNKRPVRSRSLTAALDGAYRSITPEKRFPLVVLLLELDPTRVDVNVSPTKSEVRFQNEGAVFEALRHAIKNSLANYGMIPSAEEIANVSQVMSSIRSQHFHAPDPRSHEFLAHRSSSDLMMGAQAPLFERASGGLREKVTRESPPLPLECGEVIQAALQSQRYPFEELLEELKIIGQLMRTFIVAENAKGLVLVDQHVAHERVLYEQLWRARNQARVEKQALLTPEPLHLDKVSSELLSSRLEELRSVGFEVEPFGGGSYLVRAIPAALKNKNSISVLREMIDEMLYGADLGRLIPAREQVWITCACKMAVKSGDALSHAEMEKLIADLSKTENPYLCPHGRPITVTLSRDDLFRKFKRS
jgi:DNA mismatch repair protein MutL